MPKLLRTEEQVVTKVYTLEDGELLTLYFKKLSYLDKTDLATMLATQETIRPLFRVITGWENVVDANGKKLPYNIDNLDLLLSQYQKDAQIILQDVQEFSGMGIESESTDPGNSVKPSENT